MVNKKNLRPLGDMQDISDNSAAAVHHVEFNCAYSHSNLIVMMMSSPPDNFCL